jgi:hypothetical protein
MLRKGRVLWYLSRGRHGGYRINRRRRVVVVVQEEEGCGLLNANDCPLIDPMGIATRGGSPARHLSHRSCDPSLDQKKKYFGITVIISLCKSQFQKVGGHLFVPSNVWLTKFQ